MTFTRSLRWFALPVVIALGVIVYVRRDPGEGIRFVEVAEASGLVVEPETRAEGDYRVIETMGSGVAVIDYDGDGWLDVVIGRGGTLPGDAGDGDAGAGDGDAGDGDATVESGAAGSGAQFGPSVRLFRNQRDGTFRDVTAAAGLNFAPFAQGFAVGDVDGDGHDDLFVAGFARSALFRNTGRGGFEEITERAGVAGSGWASSTALADLDGDGHLDLIVVRYLANTIDSRGKPTVRCPTRQAELNYRNGYCPPHAHSPEHDLLYRNRGDGTFEDVSERSGFADSAAPGLGVVVADLDGDGLVDIYVANDMTPNQWWQNQGEFRFQEAAAVSGLAVGEMGESRAGMGIAAGDYDRDGMIDLLVTNFQDEPNDLYRQDAPGVFSVATDDAGLRGASTRVLGFGTGFVDFDNSGELDLFVTNGHINDFRVIGKPFRQPPQLFRNLGDGRFEDRSDDCGGYFQGEWLGRGAAFGDFDNDGDTDIVVTHLGRIPALLRNETTPRGAFVGLKLVAESASRSPVGARLRVRVGSRTLHRWVVSGGSYLASSDPRVLIGIGGASSVDAVEIRWPDGDEHRFENLEADAYYEVSQGSPPRRIDRRDESGRDESGRDESGWAEPR